MDDTSGNEQSLELGSVRDSMTKSVVTLRPEQSLDDAALELERAKVTGGPVVENGVVVGVVTLRDLFKAADVPLHAAAAVVMCEGGVNRVPVIDREHHVIGILTRDDVVAAVARAHERAGGRDASLHPRMAPD